VLFRSEDANVSNMFLPHGKDVSFDAFQKRRNSQISEWNEVPESFYKKILLLAAFAVS
jgi:hypothetical protein